MTVADSKSRSRFAQPLVVEARQGRGSPPMYEPYWQPVWSASVEQITQTAGAKPSSARFFFTDLRWDDPFGLTVSDMVRIRTNEPSPGSRTILFVGFLVAVNRSFVGGSDRATGHERLMVTCLDVRFVVSRSAPLYGQVGRGRDDYSDTAMTIPIADSYTHFSGRRMVFNENGRPNRDKLALEIYNDGGYKLCEVGCFGPAGDGSRCERWTARDMICHILSPLWNFAYAYLPITDPSALTGLDNSAFDKQLNHVVVEGLDLMEAVEHICRQLGFSFRSDHFNDNTQTICFYKLGSPSVYKRTTANPVVLHRLYAPAAAEDITAAVAAGRKMLHSMELDEDITRVVNYPVGLGAPDRIEFTAELVPAWADTDFSPDDSERENLYVTEAELAELTDPNAKPFYRYYHARGASLRREVGRKWVLNEAGTYTGGPYGRGDPFDFSTVLPTELITAGGKRLYGPFKRSLLAALTLDSAGVNSTGIRVEFSFNGGATFQVIPAMIIALGDEAGIYIAEPNLAEMIPLPAATLTVGELNDIELNYFTSLAADKLAARSFRWGEWQTRIRVTASVQMDMRLIRAAEPSWSLGSPFYHRRLFDFSQRYGIRRRAASSIFYGGSLAADDADTSGLMASHLTAIREANEDMSISGIFELERLWAGDGSGFAEFAPGDCLEAIDGRGYNLTGDFGKKVLHPEIIQVVYLPDRQRTQLITRDLRFAEVRL